jgi:hypothetical protein
MSSPNPYREDEFDYLVRGALEAQVSGKEPSNRVWKQIKAELQTDGSPPARGSHVSWLALAIQAALTVVLVTIGSIAIVNPNGLRGPGYEDVAPSGTIAFVNQRMVSSNAPDFDDQAELRRLRADFGSQPVSQPNAVGDNPPIVVARDAPPNALFQEGRTHEPETSLSLIVIEQNPKRSGPYPWYR